MTHTSPTTWDRTDPEGTIAAAATRLSNVGRWGADDVHGTLNLLTPAARARAAALVRTGEAYSLAQAFDEHGPQRGWRRRTNPVHTMTDTGTDAERGNQGFPHGFGGADDWIAMPLQCSTQWDGLGHIFDHGRAWNGRAAGDVVTSHGDRVTGIQTAAGLIAGRGVLLDAGLVLGSGEGHGGELPDGFAITAEHLDAVAAAHGIELERGDIVCLRTGRLTRARREGWNGYAGGDSPGLVRPNEFDGAFQPLHQVVIPNLGLYIGEMWDLDALAYACAADGRYAFWLTAVPLPVTGAVGSPVNPLAVK